MIPIAKPFIGEEEKRELTDSVDANWITGGKKVKSFEQKIATLQGTKYGVACTNGTSALYMALKALGIGYGDEVIVPDFTFVASANAVTWTGAKPIFVDVREDTMNLDYDLIEQYLSRKTKAIIPVHIYGQCCSMGEIMTIARKYNLFVVEDAAQAVGVSYKGVMAGSFGDINCLSFYADKTLTCLTGDTRIITKIHKIGRGGSVSKQIKDLKIGDTVVSYDEKTSEKILDKVTEVYHHIVPKIKVVTTSNANRLKITGNHPVYVVNKGWIPVDDLAIGDTLIQYKYYGLGLRLNGLKEEGIPLEQRWDKERVNKWRVTHIERLKNLHKDPNSNYALMDGTTKQLRNERISKSNKRLFTTEYGKELKEQARRRLRITRSQPGFQEKQAEESRKANRNMSQETKDGRRTKCIANWQNPEYRKRVTEASNKARSTPEYLKAYAEGLLKKPNKSEQKLQKIIEEVCPDYKYNGDYKLGVSIGYYIPDFVNVNGKKKVIDLFGDRWHKPEEVEVRKGKMATLGWQCLVVWEHELKDIDAVKQKIQTFHYNPNIELVTVTKIDEIVKETDVYNIQTEINHNYFAYGILVHNCGEGGMCLTNNEDYLKRLTALNNQGRQGRGWYVHEQVGYNFRMTDLAAGIGLAQLTKLDYIIAQKKHIEKRYRELLQGVVGLPVIDADGFSVPFRVNIFVDNPEGLMAHLAEKGVASMRFFYPLHRQPCYPNYDDGEFLVSDYLYEHGLSLPSWVGLTDEQIEYICQMIKEDALK